MIPTGRCVEAWRFWLLFSFLQPHAATCHLRGLLAPDASPSQGEVLVEQSEFTSTMQIDNETLDNVLRFLRDTEEHNTQAVEALIDNGVFKDEDLTPPVIPNPASALSIPLSKLNVATLDYNGNWDVRQGDSIIQECGHTPAPWGDRRYFARHIDGNRNPAQGNLDETRCPLGCFSAERKRVHNKVFTHLTKQNLHDEGCLNEGSDCFNRSLSECTSHDTAEIPGEPLPDLGQCGVQGSPPPTAVFIIGVPAVGKDTLLKEEVKEYFQGDDPASADPDELKTFLVREGKDAYAELVRKVQEIVKSDPSTSKFVSEHYSIEQILAQHVHRESIVLSYFMMQRLREQCLSFTVQKTGTRWEGPGGLKSSVVDLKNQGYKVHVYMAHAHPFTIWMNQLHRTKTFGSAGRAMARKQVIDNSRYFPGAVKQMVEDVKARTVEIDAMKMLVYGDMSKVKADHEKPVDLFTDSDTDKFVNAWMPIQYHGANHNFNEFKGNFKELLVKKRKDLQNQIDGGDMAEEEKRAAA